MCITTTSFAVRVNGSPSSFFQTSRGLHQSNRLSPFLFVIVMEALTRLLKKACNLKLVEGVKLGKKTNQIEVTDLFFADDSLIFYKPNVDYMLNMRCILLCFQAAYGLKINLIKSEWWVLGLATVVNILPRSWAVMKNISPSNIFIFLWEPNTKTAVVGNRL